MRAFILSILLATLNAGAQTSARNFGIPMKTHKVGEVFQLVEFIKASAKRPYKIVRVDSNYRYTSRLEIILKDTTGEEKIRVTFLSYEEGGNKSLEIPGKRAYSFTSLTGSFLDIFPTWKALVEPEAEAETTSKRSNIWFRREIYGSEKTLRFAQSDGNQWYIQIR